MTPGTIGGQPVEFRQDETKFLGTLEMAWEQCQKIQPEVLKKWLAVQEYNKRQVMEPDVFGGRSSIEAMHRDRQKIGSASRKRFAKVPIAER